MLLLNDLKANFTHNGKDVQVSTIRIDSAFSELERYETVVFGLEGVATELAFSADDAIKNHNEVVNKVVWALLNK